MPHAYINDARLWYDVMGEGEPLLLHHGYTASRVNWLPVAERLRDRYQVILMECRGTGESEDTEDGYNLTQYAEDVIGIIDHIGIDKVTFAGHSMGGGIGFLLGLNYADRLNRLILMAPVPSAGIGKNYSERLNARLKARAENNRAPLKAEFLAVRFRPDVQTDEWIESRVDHLMRVSDGHLVGGMETMQALSVEDKLSSLTVPTLMLAGGVDGLLTANLSDYMRLPDASLHVFSRASHEIAIHEPDGVSDAIHQFMQHGPLTAAKLVARAKAS